MGVYVVAQISITDQNAYGKYQTAFMEVFEKFDGQLLAADANPQIVEGNWNWKKIILMNFPDEKSFQNWALSPEYQQISKDRQAGSESVVLLVKGIS